MNLHDLTARDLMMTHVAVIEPTATLLSATKEMH